MAITFKKPQTKLKLKSKSATDVARKRKFKEWAKRYHALPEDPLRVNNHQRVQRGSIGKIYPNFSYRKELHPVMLRFWRYLKDNRDLRFKYKIDFVKNGTAKKLWSWLYNNLDYPYGAKGGPKIGKSKTKRALIIACHRYSLAQGILKELTNEGYNLDELEKECESGKKQRGAAVIKGV